MRINTRILCPNSYRSRWSGMASHTLLQHRSAPRKAVRLLPVIRGRLAFCILSFYDNNQVIYFKTIISFFLNVSFPRTRREVPSRARRQGQVCVHRSESFFCVYSRLPLPTAPPPPSPYAGKAFLSLFSIFRFYSHSFSFFRFYSRPPLSSTCRLTL